MQKKCSTFLLGVTPEASLPCLEGEQFSPLVIDQILQPVFQELALLCACEEIARSRGLTIREQLHLWRPMDV